ncbi:MAG: AbrB family transcriptional regulator [Magnetovibrionaceae bacterium]
MAADAARSKFDFPWLRPLIVALIAGVPSGLMFQWLALPLPWVLGPMATLLVLTLRGVDAAVPDRLRKTALFFIGGLIGTSFSAHTLDRVGDWPWTLAAMVVFVLVCGLLGYAVLTRLARFDAKTALYCSLPGGLATMTALAEATKADVPRVSLVHGIRVMVIVFAVPLASTLILNVDRPEGTVAGGDSDPAAIAIFTLIGLLGLGIAKIMRFPVAYLTGPMTAGALAHLFGWTDATLPAWMQTLCFLVLGMAIGCRFRGTPLSEIIRISRTAGWLVLLFLLLAGAYSGFVATFLSLDFVTVLLAFAPGGVFEMCLIALALDVDPAFVAFHHLVRLFLILMLAPLVLPKLANKLDKAIACRDGT